MTEPARLFLLICLVTQYSRAASGEELRLVTLAPGHFHAALVQREALPGVSWHAAVYAPAGPELLQHIDRIARYNSRTSEPTHWILQVYAGPDYLERMLADRPGQIVVIAGRNKGKINMIRRCVAAGLHVLADKPWIIDARDFPLLVDTLNEAQQRSVIAFDCMTQRFTARYILAREIVNDKDIFGRLLAGSDADPAVRLQSVHAIAKEVSGVSNKRPLWFFDTKQQGEALADVGTHLVDLLLWILFPDEEIDWRDLRIVRARRWPAVLSEAQFRHVTGKEVPSSLRRFLHNGRFTYHCNNEVHVLIKGTHVHLAARWTYRSPWGDTESALFRGTKAAVVLAEGREQHYVPELYVVPHSQAEGPAIAAALRRRIAAIDSHRYGRPLRGISVVPEGSRLKIAIPASVRLPHEAHFSVLVRSTFLSYVRGTRTLPSWEKATMLAKYYVTTMGVQQAHVAARKEK